MVKINNFNLFLSSSLIKTFKNGVKKKSAKYAEKYQYCPDDAGVIDLIKSINPTDSGLTIFITIVIITV